MTRDQYNTILLSIIGGLVAICAYGGSRFIDDLRGEAKEVRGIVTINSGRLSILEYRSAQQSSILDSWGNRYDLDKRRK